MSLTSLAALLSLPAGADFDRAALAGRVRALRDSWNGAERAQAAALTLHWGFPSLALLALGEKGLGPASWALWAAAELRLGHFAAVLAQPEFQVSGPHTARHRVLQARAAWWAEAAQAPALAQAARQSARAEGDAPALVAAAVLCAEIQLAGDPKAALRSLAEGLKVAEVVGEEADPHLLAVLAHTQKRVGGEAKAGRTAQKALARAQPRSPARVLALLALADEQTAWAEAEAGELSPLWWRASASGV